MIRALLLCVLSTSAVAGTLPTSIAVFTGGVETIYYHCQVLSSTAHQLRAYCAGSLIEQSSPTKKTGGVSDVEITTPGSYFHGHACHNVSGWSYYNFECGAEVFSNGFENAIKSPLGSSATTSTAAATT